MKKIFIGLTLASQMYFAQVSLVKDIRSGTSGSLLSGIIPYNGSLIFKASDGVDGSELWKSDGSAAGTTEIADTNPGSASFNPVNMVEFNSKLYFSGLTAALGSEIFSYDGTTISIAADIKPGSGSSAPGFIIPFAGNLYFRAQEAASTTYRLYKMTPANVYSVLDNTNIVGTSAAVLGSQLLFSGGSAASNTQLYTTDGTTITLLKTINSAASATVTNLYTAPALNKTFFQANNGTDGKELWITDGTVAGTKMLADINPTGDSNPGEFYEFNGKVYFQATATTGNTELWSTDGVTVTLVKDINATGSSLPSNFFAYNNLLYFSANDGVYGIELWRTDGTSGQTLLFADINAGAGSSSPTDLAAFAGTIYLGADNGTTGKELYKISAATLAVQASKTQAINIFPNPSNGSFNFDKNITGSYQVFSYAGNLLKSGLLQNSKKIDLQLPAGNYLMIVDAQKSKTTFPIIIKK